jgi:hypothetical protein
MLEVGISLIEGKVKERREGLATQLGTGGRGVRTINLL